MMERFSTRREGHFEWEAASMAAVSKVWDAAGERASGSKKTTRNQDFFPVILTVSMLVNSRK